MKAQATPEKMKLSDLSQGAQAAVTQKSITGGWDGRSLTKLLAELERWDNMAEVRKSRAKRIFLTGAIGTVIGVFLFFIVGLAVGVLWLGVTLALVPLLVLILGIKMKRAARAIDLPNELRISLRPVFRKLSQDLHPDEKIRVEMNLAGLDEKSKKGTQDVPSRRGTAKQTTYTEDLCTIRMPLADGYQAVLRMDNTFLEIVRRTSNSRGKVKSKTKWKKLTTVTAILIPPERINWEPSRVQKFVDTYNERLTFVDKNGVMAARLDRYYKFKTAENAPEEAAPATDIIRMFVRLSGMRPQLAGGAQ